MRLVSQWASQGPWLYHDDWSTPGGWCTEECDGAALLPTHAPRVGELLVHLLACFVVFDASYFAWHWAHHASPVLYKHVHAVHHEYRAPFCWGNAHTHTRARARLVRLRPCLTLALTRVYCVWHDAPAQ